MPAASAATLAPINSAGWESTARDRAIFHKLGPDCSRSADNKYKSPMITPQTTYNIGHVNQCHNIQSWRFPHEMNPTGGANKTVAVKNQSKTFATDVLRINTPP